MNEHDPPEPGSNSTHRSMMYVTVGQYGLPFKLSRNDAKPAENDSRVGSPGTSSLSEGGRPSSAAPSTPAAPPSASADEWKGR